MCEGNAPDPMAKPLLLGVGGRVLDAPMCFLTKRDDP
jgi:hypothetical protein